MPLTTDNQNAVLRSARRLIGMNYQDIDCSHFVHRAYAEAGLSYPYTSTIAFHGLRTQFDELHITQAEYQPADLILFAGHVGIWDPDGCAILQSEGNASAQCTRLGTAPVLSSRSGGNLGPEFGRMAFFSPPIAVYRWK